MAALSGYVYQIYQSALAWLGATPDDQIWLEVSEDYLKVAKNALEAVQVKETSECITINSKGVLAAIDSYVSLHLDNPKFNLSLRFLSTSTIGRERKIEDRLNGQAVLEEWRRLATSGNLTEFRALLSRKNLNERTKKFIQDHDDDTLRVSLLCKIHFDSGSPDSTKLRRLLIGRLSEALILRRGVHSQAETCLAKMVQKLLEVATNPHRYDRFVDKVALEDILEKATQVVQSRAQFETREQLLQGMLPKAFSTDSRFSDTTELIPRPAKDAQIPRAIAARHNLMDHVALSVRKYGVCWIHGGAGMGKTIAARANAKALGGDWATINFRDKRDEFVVRVLEGIAVKLSSAQIAGLIIDDFDSELPPNLVDSLSVLLTAAVYSAIPVVITAPREAPANVLFDLNLNIDVCVKVNEFSEDDISEILRALGVNSTEWTKYIHLVSGGGHPQLAAAAIQSLQASEWPKSEFTSCNALFVGNPQIEQVRLQTRLRLLREMPENSRHLLERLSLKLGGFKRDLALKLTQLDPPLRNGGPTFDTLIGTWIDQHAADRFFLSPLLSDLAARNLSVADQKAIHYAIASSLTEGNVLDGGEVNAAMFSAQFAGNEEIMQNLCGTIFRADHDEMEMIAQHMVSLTLMPTDQVAYAGNAALSHMLRGTQLLLISQKASSGIRFWDVYDRFVMEGRAAHPVEHRSQLDLLIYVKLLLMKPKQSLGGRFVRLIANFNDFLIGKQLGISEDIKRHLALQRKDGVDVASFMFQNHCECLKTLNDIEYVFEFLDQSQANFRDKLIAAYRHKDMDIGMLVSSAWLGEQETETIDANAHAALFLRLEKMASSWGYFDLAAYCCKYQATILNEYGSDKQGALDIIERGLVEYGATNSGLVREKATVLYLSGDHAASLSVANMLIESDAALNPVEKTFFGRQAAISAENEGRYDLARQYYLFASEAARLSKIENMEPIYVGLLADAAMASWLNGDRETCIRDFAAVLGQVTTFPPERSLRTAHCHAVVRHILLWIEWDVKDKKKYNRDGEEPHIYPGCASQPEPHKDIAQQIRTPIEMAWYMLASIECYTELDVGIMKILHSLLSNDDVYEGQILIAPAKIHRALATLDIKLFDDAMSSLTAAGAFVVSRGGPQNSFDMENVTFGMIPQATKVQQVGLKDQAADHALLFAAMCIFGGQNSKIEELVALCRGSSSFVVDSTVTDRLVSVGHVDGDYSRLAELLYQASQAHRDPEKLSPLQLFEVSLKILQFAERNQELKVVGKAICPWLAKRWEFAWERQRFRLNRPNLHEEQVKEALANASKPTVVAVIELLASMLPLLSINNATEMNGILTQMRSKT